MEDTTMNVRDFCAAYKVTATIKRIPSRTDGGIGDDAEWNRKASHYHFILHYQGRTTSGEYSCGSGWTEAPDAADILNSLMCDASCYEQNGDDVAEFIKEWSQYRKDKRGYGWVEIGKEYTTVDERKVQREHARLRKTFAGCKKYAGALRRVFGEETYELLMSGEIEGL